MDKRHFAMVIGLLTMALVMPGSLTARPYGISDLFATEGLGKIMVSRNGRWLVFERQEAYRTMARFDMLSEARLLRSRPFRVDLDRPDKAQPLVPGDSLPGTMIYGFSPEGSRIAIGRLRGDRWQLGVVTLADGAARWFDLSPAYDPFASTLDWLSENHLVTIREPNGQRPWWLRLQHEDSRFLPERWAAVARGGPATVTAIGSGRYRAVTPAPPSRDLILLNVKTGHEERLMQGQIGEVQIMPDRRGIMVYDKRASRRFQAGGSVESGSPIPDRPVILFRPDALGRWRRCRACGTTRAVPGLSDASLSPAPSLSLGTGEKIEAVGRRPDGPLHIIRTARPDGIEELVIVTRKGRQSVARINERLAAVDPAITVPLHHRLPDGGLVTSWLYLPPGPQGKGARLPLVVLPYPGDVFGETPPADQAVNAGRFYDNAQLLAARGYAVLLPSMPLLPMSRTHAFRFDAQIAAAVDAAIGTGKIDPERLIVWGHSYGAYAAAIVATQTQRYRAIIASSGIYDLGSLPGTLTPWSRMNPQQGLPMDARAIWITSGQGRMGVLPWEDPARFVANSPLYQAGRIATPLLIITADRDAVPMQQAEQLFSALYVQDKNAQLLTYWGEGHAIGSLANAEDMYGRIFAWLEACLGGQGAPGSARSQ